MEGTKYRVSLIVEVADTEYENPKNAIKKMIQQNLPLYFNEHGEMCEKEASFLEECSLHLQNVEVTRIQEIHTP